MTDISDLQDKMWTQEDRDYVDQRYREIAELMLKKGYVPSNHKKDWKVEDEDGRVFKFQLTGYLKRNSKAEKEHNAEQEKLLEEFSAEFD